jgi:glycosyltransferase involved in cell wall biosynthesis
MSSLPIHANGGDPLVSFIMPVWRPTPEWLGQAVESALGQRGCRIELIVVDDGNAEPVAPLLSWAADERLRIVRIDHGGASRARNAGIAASSGSHLRFIDCDDVLDLNSSARLLRLVGNDNGIVAYGATIVCDEQLRPRGKIDSQLQGWAATECLLDRFTVRLPAMLFPRNIVQAVGEWDPAITVCEDWDFVLRALDHAQVLGQHEAAVYYRRHAGSASRNSAACWLGWQGTLRVVRKYLDRHPEARGTSLETRIQVLLDDLASEAVGRQPWRSIQFWRGSFADPGAALPLLRYHLMRKMMKALLSQTARKILPTSVRRWLRSR